MPGDKTIHAFFYSDGKIMDLGTLGGDQSEAHALNDAGQVTGNADTKDKDKRHDFVRHAFLWQNGKMSELGTSKADTSDGLAINGAGQVVGRISRGWLGLSRACFWLGGKVNTLEDSGAGSSEAGGINSQGQMVGTFREPGRPFKDLQADGIYYCDHAVLWGRPKALELGLPGTEISQANAINDGGEVAGTASFSPYPILHACVWQRGKMTDLGQLAGQDTVVYAINGTGLMVGGTNSNDLEENGKDRGDADQPQYAFCCSGKRIINLNSLIEPTSGWTLTDAHSISDTGYVTGAGTHNGQPHAYLLKLPSNL